MWKKINIENVEKIERCVGEFNIWMHNILPYGKMKIKVYEDIDSTFTGCTDVKLKRKFDGEFEGAVGYGHSIEQALEDTVNWFQKMVEEDYPKDEYPNGLEEDFIECTDFADF